MKVKLCGFKDQESIQAAIETGVDFIGFIFYEKSVRYIDPKQAATVSQIIPQNIGKVAVTVDATLDQINHIIQTFQPTHLQLHGNESSEYITQIKQLHPYLKIIKAIPIEQKEDLNNIKDFENIIDYFLFDSKDTQQKGGTGHAFDWSILSDLKTKKEWFLSGGLNTDNVVRAISQTGAKMIDISSGIEEVKGEKSSPLIKQFMSLFR